MCLRLAPHTPFRPLEPPFRPVLPSAQLPHTRFRPSLPSAPYSLPPRTRFRPRLASAPGSLSPHFRPTGSLPGPSAPASLPPQAPSPFRPGAPGSLPAQPQPAFRPSLPSGPACLPPQAPFRPRLPPAPASLPPVGVRGCLSADVECEGAALARCSASMCECAARKCGGSQASPLPSCAPVVARLAVHARSHSMAPNERSRASSNYG